jgi:shikimate dehydrogenase
VGHSFSPIIHNYLYEVYGENIVYLCFDVDRDWLQKASSALGTLEMIGANVTIPHKVDIMKYLDEIDLNADIIGAVNTIQNRGGILKGYNTDGRGFVKSILDGGFEISGKNILLIGAGGAARSISVELASQGASSITIANRSLEKAEEIVKIIRSNFNTDVNAIGFDISQSQLDGVEILINTTPIGMNVAGTDSIFKMPIDEKLDLGSDVLVCDIVYNPDETEFIKWAKSQGSDVVLGIDMLINQAFESFHIWTGKMPTEVDRYKIKELLSDPR